MAQAIDRVVAYIVDVLVSWVWGILLVFVLFMAVLGNAGVSVAVLAGAIWFAFCVWWVLLLRRGQTPGKLIMKLWVVRDSADPAGWGLMLVREVLVKGLLFGLIGGTTFYIGVLVDLLWPLWDRNKQTLHDRSQGTHVVQGPRQERVAAGPTR